MKTTLEIPDALFRRAKSAAAERGIPLREFVTEAVKEKLADTRKDGDRPWMAGFGKLRHLRKESARISRLIEEEFEQVEAEDRL
ncbi:MAG TPA: hypothetical protein VIX19_17320 [Terriglobales bacterium]